MQFLVILSGDGLEEVVAFVVHKDECREILDADFPDGLHTELRIFHTFDGLDVVLGKDGCRTSDGSEIESSVFLTSVCDSL